MIDTIHQWAKGKGFWFNFSKINFFEINSGLDHFVYEEFVSMEKARKIALMHSELSECLEAIRKPKQDEHCPEFTNETIELADAIIRIFDYAGRYNLPLAQAILAKHNFNQGRPHKHGKAF